MIAFEPLKVRSGWMPAAALLLGLVLGCTVEAQPGPSREKFFQPAAPAGERLPADGIYPRGRRFPLSLFSVGGNSRGEEGWSALSEQQQQKWMQRVAEDGFTMFGPQYELNDRVLADAAEHGVKAIYTIGVASKKELGELSPEQIRQRTREHVKQVLADPNSDRLAWWYVHPEELRWWKGREIRYLEHVAETIRQADPKGRPVWMYDPGHRDAGALKRTAAHLDIVGKGMYTNYSGQVNDRVWVRWTIEQQKQAIAALQGAGRSETFEGITGSNDAPPDGYAGGVGTYRTKPDPDGGDGAGDGGITTRGGADPVIHDLPVTIEAGVEYTLSATLWQAASSYTRQRLELRVDSETVASNDLGYVTGPTQAKVSWTGTEEHAGKELLLAWAETSGEKVRVAGMDNWRVTSPDTAPSRIPIAVPELFRHPGRYVEALADDEQAAREAIQRWVRHDAYAALIEGAKGMVVFSLRQRTNSDLSLAGAIHETYYESYARVARELTGELGLGDVFLFGERREDVEVHVIDGPETLTLEYRNNDPVTYPTIGLANRAMGRQRYLFFVNSADKPVTAMATELPYGDDITVRDLFQDRTFALGEGEFQMSFEPYEVKAFRIEPPETE